MPTASALQAAVIADPDDDLVRLVYADFVEENGDPARGELIRIQCELARLPEWDREAAELRHRERVLLARHGRQWLRELPAIAGVRWGEFRRGFIDEIHVADLGALFAVAESLGQLTPLSGVTLRSLPGERIRPRSVPWLRRLRVEIEDRDGIDLSALERFFDLPVAERLTGLDLSGHRVGNAGAAVLGRASGLTELKWLNLAGCFVDADGVRALAEAKHLSGLTSLRLASYPHSDLDDPVAEDAGLEVVASSRTFANLTELSVGNVGLPSDGFRRLLESQTLTNLAKVVFASETPATDDDFQAGPTAARWRSLSIIRFHAGRDGAGFDLVANCPQLQNLERLRIHGWRMKPEAMRAFARSPVRETLQELKLTYCEIDTAVLDSFAEVRWPRLHCLSLFEIPLGEHGASVLSGADLPAMRSLYLSANRLGASGAIRLLGAPWLQSVRELELSNNKIGPEFGSVFAACRNVRRVAKLNLFGNPLGATATEAICATELPELTDVMLLHNTPSGDDAVRGLSRAGSFQTLVTLNLGNTGLTAAGAEELSRQEAPQLGALVLHDASLSDEGVRHFSRADWPALRELSVQRCRITARGWTELTEAAFFQELRALGHYGNDAPPQASGTTDRWGAVLERTPDPTWLDSRSLSFPSYPHRED